MAAQAGDVGLQVIVWLHQARLASSRSAPDKALALAQRAAAQASERDSPLWLADAADVIARAALMQGDMHRALHHARRAVALAEIAQATPAYAMTYRVYESYALLGLGAYDEALALIRELAQIPQPSFLTERQRLLARIYALVRDDRAGGWSEHSRAELAAVIGRLRELDWPGVLALLPQVVARLWARALDAGIETDWVRASIRNRDLPPHEPSWPAAWPWDVRISVLGSFSCVVDGRELEAGPSGKVAAKPLALLRRLAVEGGHDGVAADALARALWPGEGREGRDKTLETTLSRLRRLLGRADAVLLHERKLRLNPQRVWLDSAALARQLDRLQRPARANSPEIDRERAWDAALALWRGPLLADEGDAPWIEPARERLRMRAAAVLHDHARHEGHRARCLRAIAADPALERLL
jgi:tetratricopeptide (TPR) repeat protein